MELVYITHPACSRHLAGTNHPEHPSRLEAVAAGVAQSGKQWREVTAEPAARRWIDAVHEPAYVERLREFSENGGGIVDSDTWVDEATWEAALVAAGAGATGLAIEADTAFLAIRPPGHHARSAQAMGFCFLNNVAITAAELRGAGKRVAIIDWDVHHGNATQEMLADDPATLYISLHQSPFYPLTGSLGETGERGTVLNLPLPAGTAGDVYRTAFSDLIAPILTQFAPDHLLLSAGYDAHRADPLAEMALVADDYAMMSHTLRAATPGVPAMAFLEGGYDPQALTDSVAATIRGLLGESEFGPAGGQSPPEAWNVLARAREISAGFWKV